MPVDVFRFLTGYTFLFGGVGVGRGGEGAQPSFAAGVHDASGSWVFSWEMDGCLDWDYEDPRRPRGGAE